MWLEWNYSILKIFIEGFDDVNAAYKHVKDVVRVDPSYADVGRRMESNYDQLIRNIYSRINRENKRLNSLNAEGREREAQYIQDWYNTVREIEEYIKTNEPNFLKEGQSDSSYQSSCTNSSASFSPDANPMREYNAYGPSVNSVKNNSPYGKKNTYFDSMFKDAPFLAIILGLGFTLVFGSVIVIGYVALSILPLTSMILALEAATKVNQRIYQPEEKNSFFTFVVSFR